MEKEILWDEHLSEQFGKVEYENLDSFLELLYYIDDNKISNKMSTELYHDEDLWSWLSSKEQIKLRDVKKELSIKIERAKKIGEQEYKDVSSSVGILKDKKIFVLHFDDNNVFYISSMAEYYEGLRCYLVMEKKSDFCKDMLECFPNLMFVDDISATINSLNREFAELKEEIVEHLTAINNYRSKFELLLSQNKSNQVIAQEFSYDTGIECSPQAGRVGVQSLKLSCYNEISQQTEIIKCELHTKFKKYNVDRTKQDRIYFFPGRAGIHNGKIIIKHIGKHL